MERDRWESETVESESEAIEAEVGGEMKARRHSVHESADEKSEG